QVSSIRDELQACPDDAVDEEARVRGLDEPILGPPHHERRRPDAVKAALETTVGDRKEKLGGRLEAASERDQELHLRVRAIVLVREQRTDAEHLLRRRTRRVVKE